MQPFFVLAGCLNKWWMSQDPAVSGRSECTAWRTDRTSRHLLGTTWLAKVDTRLGSSCSGLFSLASSKINPKRKARFTQERSFGFSCFPTFRKARSIRHQTPRDLKNRTKKDKKRNKSFSFPLPGVAVKGLPHRTPEIKNHECIVRRVVVRFFHRIFPTCR